MSASLRLCSYNMGALGSNRDMVMAWLLRTSIDPDSPLDNAKIMSSFKTFKTTSKLFVPPSIAYKFLKDHEITQITEIKKIDSKEKSMNTDDVAEAYSKANSLDEKTEISPLDNPEIQRGILEYRLKAFENLLKMTNADIIGLQEADYWLANGLCDKYTYASCGDRLKTAIGWTDRFELIQQGPQTKTSKTTVVKLLDKTLGITIAVASAHFRGQDPIKGIDVFAISEFLEMDTLLKTQDADLSIALMDSNVTRGSALFAAIEKKKYVVSSEIKDTNINPVSGHKQEIDYIAHNSHYLSRVRVMRMSNAVVLESVDKKEPSDHRPLCTEIDIAKDPDLKKKTKGTQKSQGCPSNNCAIC